ncbi:MAG: UPF0149 family protein [Xanthomonadales bacterium]|nr:UPF0149 family protein [Xanthomonadales bacterium]MBK7144502.1 UPF0149 family protein [Xanthomonadales bacterium]MCC6561151.1 UPF0149 family protein [Xanthomonadales bacterium]
MNALAHDELEDLLLRLQAGVGAAELHGALSGYLCGGGRSPAERWGDALAVDAVQEALAGSSAEADDLRRLHRETNASLADPEDSFTPLLPDDEVALAQRADALVDWCRGFLGGVGLANPRARGELSAEAEEAIGDLGRIAASELSVEEGDADEAAYVEVLEFVRVVALLLRDECAAAARRH